ncbi:hypothetical protein [Halobellus salinisoli]|uniref:hypothetical protein n=1 Tax=Halobellus salinisoli TaxID=3108500 RepID=UPI00300B4364
MSSQTDPEDLYERLLDEGLFESEDEQLQLGEEFVSARQRFRKAIAGRDEDADVPRLGEYVERTPFSAEEVDDGTFADALAVSDVCETVDAGTSLHVALSLDRSEAAEDESHVPAGFVSLAGEEIESFLRAHPASIVYCWRENCDPCRAVGDHLADLRRDGTILEQFGLAAVYGPDNAEVLSEKYDMGGSPTTLFCAGTTIESRFMGNPGPKGLRREINTLAKNL